MAEQADKAMAITANDRGLSARGGINLEKDWIKVISFKVTKKPLAKIPERQIVNAIDRRWGLFCD
jgi:hypothetical protein